MSKILFNPLGEQIKTGSLYERLHNEVIAVFESVSDKDFTKHWGVVEIGYLVDWLEENYVLTLKDLNA